MPQATRQKPTAVPVPATLAQAGQRKPADGPQPLDLKTLERVAGGMSAELPRKGW